MQPAGCPRLSVKEKCFPAPCPCGHLRFTHAVGGPDNLLSGLRASASNKRTVPPPACAFGAAITSNRGHPRQRATSEGWRVARTTCCPGCERQRATSEGWPSPLVRLRRTPIASNRGHCSPPANPDCKQSGPPADGGLRGWPGQLVVRVASVSEQHANGGFRRLFASGEPRLQAIGATRVSEQQANGGLRRLFASGEPRLQAIGATRVAFAACSPPANPDCKQSGPPVSASNKRTVAFAACSPPANPDCKQSGPPASASDKRTVPPPACAFGAAITSNRGHPRLLVIGATLANVLPRGAASHAAER